MVFRFMLGPLWSIIGGGFGRRDGELNRGQLAWYCGFIEHWQRLNYRGVGW